MQITMIFKPPFNGVFGLEQTEVEAAEGSSIKTVVDAFIEKQGAMDDLIAKQLIENGELQTIYVLNKHIRGGTIVKDDKVLEDTDMLTVLGTFIGG